MRDVSPDFLIMGKQALVKKRTTDAPVAFTLHQTLAGDRHRPEDRLQQP
jgi:hypothetical protein